METKRNLAITCPEPCSLHPSKIGQKNADILKVVRENGGGRYVFARRVEELLGHPMPHSNIQRHFGHYVEVIDPAAEPEVGPKPSDVAILDSIITAGYRNSRNWKPSIKDTLDAMKLKVQMTGQSAFEDMIAAMDAALDLPDVDEDAEIDGIEAPEAIFAPEETPETEEEDE